MNETNTDFIFHSKRFEYTDSRYPLGGKSFCQLDIFVPSDWKQKIPCALVIFTDPGRDSGVSITNASEVVAEKAWKDIILPRYGKELPPSTILFVERYGRISGRDFETLDQISYSYVATPIGLTFASPQWRRIGVSDIAKAFPNAKELRV